MLSLGLSKRMQKGSAWDNKDVQTLSESPRLASRLMLALLDQGMLPDIQDAGCKRVNKVGCLSERRWVQAAPLVMARDEAHCWAF